MEEYAAGITCTIIFYPCLSSLYYASPNAFSPKCAHCSFDSVTGSTTGTQHSCLLRCSSLPPSLFLFTRPLLTTNFSANSREIRVVFSVVEGCCQITGTPLHIQKWLPDVFWSSARCIGVACHRPLVSPHWLATLSRRLLTDRCWLTNQQLSTTNLCCWLSRLTVFCVTVIELNR